jgi:outer membrane protein OmpA-like peptidoglycan-associated protein
VDGVPDYQDMCPNTLPNIGVDSTGCAKDEDRDGVADDNDKCPATGKGIPVDTTGCPMDTDKDGVPDYQDKCPNTLRGVKIDKKGCPVNKREDLERLKKGINFKSGSTVLTKPSFKTLDDIVSLLNKFPEVNLEIQGHTDNVGEEEYNMNLSQGRAQSAVDYLIRKGIPVERLRAKGFGPTKPIADNKKKAGRAKNRRVELVPFYNDEQ